MTATEQKAMTMSRDDGLLADEIEYAIKTAGQATLFEGGAAQVVAALRAQAGCSDTRQGVNGLRDRIAELIWRSEYRRATGKERTIEWAEVADKDVEKYLYVAEAIVQLLAAQPANTGQAVAWRSRTIQGKWMYSDVRPDNGVEVQALGLLSQASSPARNTASIEHAIREHFRGLGNSAVVASDGIERVYYSAGFSLKKLAEAIVAASLPRDAQQGAAE